MLNKNNREKGLVTLISVIIIIIIISIITLSLAALTRRNLRQAVDEQLSSQALYAAESGINEAVKKINSGLISTPITTCDKTGPAGPGITFDSQNLADPTVANVKYTCVLVTFDAADITAELKNESMKVYPLKDVNPANFINNLTITWSDPNNASPNFSTCATDSCLTAQTQTGWVNRLGLLRVKLIPIPSTGLNSSGIDANSIDITAYPFQLLTRLPSSPPDLTTKNHVLAGTCSGSSCSVSINGLYNSANTTAFPGRYYILIQSYYTSTTTVKITGSTVNAAGASVGSAAFSGAQATIDSTGVAGDSVKRLVVKLSLDKTSELPIYTLGVGGSVCKRFTSAQGGSYTDVPTGFAANYCDQFSL